MLDAGRARRLKTGDRISPVAVRSSVCGWLLAVLVRRPRARGVGAARHGIGWLVGGGSGGRSPIGWSGSGRGSCLREPAGGGGSRAGGRALPGGWSLPSELARLWGGAPLTCGAIPGSPGIVAGSQVISRKVCGT